MFGRKPKKEPEIVDSEVEEVELDSYEPKPKGKPVADKEEPQVVMVTEYQVIMELLAKIEGKLDKVLKLAQE